MVLQRFLGRPKPKPQATTGMPLADIQQCLRDALIGCDGVRAGRLLYRIDIARTPAELWALRSDLHQCVAQIQSEGVAAYRINGLSAVFQGWIPAVQLVKIQPDFKPSKK